jgi:uncharacterized protein (DUF305 family)
MTVDTIEEQVTVAEDPRSSSLATVLKSIIAIAVLAIAVAGGFAWGHSGTKAATSYSTGTPNASDIGFARDMAVHHQQAVDMAGYERDNSTDKALVTVAFDIETSQSIQLGQMLGWLNTWGVSQNDPTPMTWMVGHDHLDNGLMPGMATPAQMTKLMTLHGKPLDIFFLQLMIHHHQGGVEMANYAMTHASIGYVKDLASSIYAAQSNEIIQMEQALRALGGTPLPPPVD